MQLENDVRGYAGVMIQAMLAHLKKRYGKMTYTDMANNREKMSEEWNPEHPIDTVWIRIKEVRENAREMGNPISEQDAVAAAVTVIQKTNLFEGDMLIWNKVTWDEWMMENVTEFFSKADDDRQCHRTAKQAGYSANQAAVQKKELANATMKEELKPRQNKRKEISYCWSHRFGFNPEHNSKSCKRRELGHKETATIYDLKGGCNVMH